MNSSVTARIAVCAVAVWVCTTAVYLADRSKLDAHDAIPARYLPYSILSEGDADLTEFRFLYRDGTPYYLQEREGRYHSTYPIGSAVVALPLYAGVRMVRGRLELQWAEALEKWAAAMLAAGSVLFVFLALASAGPLPLALAGACIYAFGTNTWAVTSQAQWQHTSSQLFVAAALWALVRAREQGWWAILAGALVSAAVACRPTNIAFAAAAAGYVAVVHRRRFALFLGAAAPCAMLVAWYNASTFGSLVGGYSGCLAVYTRGLSVGERLVNLAGLLASPSRGLWVYSPVLIAAVPSIIRAWRRGGDPLDRALVVAVLGHTAIVMQWRWWHGGVTFGPRLMNDVLPLLVWLAVPALARWWGAGGLRRCVCAAAILWSVGVQLLGVLRYDARWDLAVDPARNPSALWDVRRSQLIFALLDGAMETSPRTSPAHYRVSSDAAVSSAGFDRYVGYGMGVAEPWGRWGLGRESLVLVSFDDPGPWRICVEAFAPSRGGVAGTQELTVLVDGRVVGIYTLPADGATTRIIVPLPPVRTDQSLAVSFRYRWWVQPARRGFGDARKLAVGFRNIRFERDTGTCVK